MAGRCGGGAASSTSFPGSMRRERVATAGQMPDAGWWLDERRATSDERPVVVFQRPVTAPLLFKLSWAHFFEVPERGFFRDLEGEGGVSTSTPCLGATEPGTTMDATESKVALQCGKLEGLVLACRVRCWGALLGCALVRSIQGFSQTMRGTGRGAHLHSRGANLQQGRSWVTRIEVRGRVSRFQVRGCGPWLPSWGRPSLD